jgi:hypothetical protein
MLRRCRGSAVTVLVFAVLPISSARAGEPFRFPEARYGQGELKYRNGLPLLMVEGTPEQIGAQVAALVGKPSARLLNYPKEVLSHFATPAVMKLMWPGLVKQGQRLLDNFPPAYRAEFEAMVKVGGLERELLMMGNTAFDMKKDLNALFGCSAVIVEARRSLTGKPIFGRNMDHFPLGYLHQYSLVTVYRPRGKHAFAGVGYAGMVGCISGINDAGLTLAALETTGAPEGEGPIFNPDGVPFALCYRRVLEECTTIPEAEAMLRGMKRTTTNNLSICDLQGSAVFEITPSRIIVRRSENSLSICTNHFCTDELRLLKPKNQFTTLDRFATLEKVRASDKRIGVADVHHYLDAVNQGEFTLQTMIFEPADLTLHLSIMEGRTPASALPLKTLPLAALFSERRTD